MTERIKLINTWARTCLGARDRLLDIDMYSQNGVPRGVSHIVDTMGVAYTEAVAKLVGDTCGVLQWYAAVNDFGMNGLSIKGKPIDTFEDLLELIDKHVYIKGT